jgi:hypothetical protein
LLQALQAAGVVRQGVNIAAMAYIMDVVAASIVEYGPGAHPSTAPPYDALMETAAEMLDRRLTPADGGSLEAGKALVRQMAERARAQLDQMTHQTERQTAS